MNEKKHHGAVPAGQKKQQQRPDGRPKPHFHRIERTDLVDDGRLEGLFRSAVSLKLIGGSEADVVNFWSAAVHAVRCGANPPALLAAVVRRRLFHNITDADEVEAHRRLARYVGHPSELAGGAS